jgi:hypothetical protein
MEPINSFQKIFMGNYLNDVFLMRQHIYNSNLPGPLSHFAHNQITIFPPRKLYVDCSLCYTIQIKVSGLWRGIWAVQESAIWEIELFDSGAWVDSVLWLAGFTAEPVRHIFPCIVDQRFALRRCEIGLNGLREIQNLVKKHHPHVD